MPGHCKNNQIMHVLPRKAKIVFVIRFKVRSEEKHRE